VGIQSRSRETSCSIPFLRHLRHAHALGRLVEASGVHLGAKQCYASIVPFVCLETFEDFLGVVKDQAGRIEQKRLVGLDASITPALAGLPFNQQHAVGEVFTESELGFIGDFSFHLFGR